MTGQLIVIIFELAKRNCHAHRTDLFSGLLANGVACNNAVLDIFAVLSGCCLLGDLNLGPRRNPFNTAPFPKGLAQGTLAAPWAPKTQH